MSADERLAAIDAEADGAYHRERGEGESQLWSVRAKMAVYKRRLRAALERNEALEEALREIAKEDLKHPRHTRGHQCDYRARLQSYRTKATALLERREEA